MPELNFTAPQLADMLFALHRGLANAAWEGLGERAWSDLTAAERQMQVDEARRRVENQAARTGAMALELNRQFLARFDLTTIEQDEAAALQRHEQMRTMNKKVGGLKMAVNDLLSQAVHFSAQQRLAVDRRLAAAQLPPLRELSRKLERNLAAILKRAKIRNEEEYYLVKEIVCDQAAEVSETERAEFERLLLAFEAGAAKGKP